MSDDLTKKRPQDASKINPSQQYIIDVDKLPDLFKWLVDW